MAPRKSVRKLSKARKKSAPRKRPLTGNRWSKVGRDFEKLVAVMARLRAPGGCPWDREQTHATLRTYLIEEAYEVLDALDSTDDGKFAEELGDLLLQVLFHAQIAHEEHRFSITDVIREIHDKMVRRHPHVFGDSSAKTPADVLRNWEIIKKQERAAKLVPPPKKGNGGRSFSSDKTLLPQKGASALEELVSILDGVPRALPALLEALQLTRKASRIGFDWPDVDGIFAKLTEEVHELQAALVARGESASPAAVSSRTKPSHIQNQSSQNQNPSSRAKREISPSAGAEALSSAHIESEIGDLLFVLVNLARFLHVDPELALKKTSAKFTRRFHQMEQFAREQNTSLAQIPREHLESLWDRAKLLE